MGYLLNVTRCALFGAVAIVSISEAQVKQSADAPVPAVIPCPDPSVHLFPLAAMQPDPNGPTPHRLSAEAYWRAHYHSKVTHFVFDILSYPYYFRGKDYVSDGPGYATVFKAFPIEASEEPSSDAERPEPLDPNFATDRRLNAASGSIGAQADSIRLYEAAIECAELIYQWRTMNESPGTALEVAVSMELTKTSTGIYQIKPELAVLVKRIVGRIAQLNRQFDEVSRLTLAKILKGDLDKSLMQRLNKIVADIESLLNQLAETNDKISTVLGAGEIDRRPAWPREAELVDYSDLAPLPKAGN